MRIVGMLSMTALILTGLPPVPAASLSASVQAREGRIARPLPSEDPDARCAPFLQGGGDYGSFASRGGYRGNSMGFIGNTPTPTRPRVASPPQAPPMAEMRPQDQSQALMNGRRHMPQQPMPSYAPPENRERYQGEAVAAVQSVAEVPVSTFSVDVDTGSYSNVRRMLNAGEMPPQAAVRTEELLNYFRYDYPAHRSLAAVQRAGRHDDDAVEPGDPAASSRPSRL
jgi:Ca-activated chloride channel family protein